MKVIARKIPLTLAGTTHTCNILVGLYAVGSRPAVILVATRPDDYPGSLAWEGAPLAIASSVCPPEYIQHLSPAHFPAKTWTENEGLWDQLLLLTDEDNFPLFLQTRHKVTLGFSTAPIMLLGPNAAEAFDQLLVEIALPSPGAFHE